MKKHERGFTLIEILLAMGIMSIVLVSYLSLFGNGFVTIVSMGNKSRAGVEAQELVDRIYAEAVFSNAAQLRQSIAQILDQVYSSNYEDYTDKIADFDEANTANTKVRFYVESGQSLLINQNNVFVATVRVYYHHYKRHVTISTPIIR